MQTLPPVYARLALIGVVLAAAVLTVEELYVITVGSEAAPIPAWAIISQLILAATSGTLALVLVRRAFQRAQTRVLAGHFAFLSLGWATIVQAGFSHVLLYDTVFAFAGAFALSAFVHFTLLFPSRLASSDLAPGKKREFGRSLQAKVIRRPALLWWGGGVFGLLWLGYGVAEAHTMLPPPAGRAALLFLLLLFVAGAALGLSFLRVGYRKADPEDRRKILWIVEGYVLAFLVIVAFVIALGLAFATGSGALATLALYLWFGGYSAAALALLLCFMIAIFYSGAFDPALTLRRTAVYGVLAIALTFLFAGLESALSATMVERLGLPEAADTWIGGGLAALLFGPVRDKLDRILRPYFGEVKIQGRQASDQDLTEH